MGVYHIATMLYLLDNPQVLRISGKTYQETDMDAERREKSGYSVEELGLGFVRFEGGLTMDIIESWAIHLDNFEGCSIAGSKGGIRLEPFGFFQNVGDLELSATTDLVRDQLMPINKRWPIAVLLEACRAYPLPDRRRLTVEYVLLDGVNDSPDDAKRLVRLLRGIRCKINLIPFNATPDLPDRPSPRERIERFQQILYDAHLTATIRESRGRDISAACGMLRVERERGEPASSG
jgi:hypothetical protein